MRKATPNIDYTDRDYEAFRESMISNLKVTMPEYTDISETDAGIVLLEGLAKGLDVLSLYQDITANDLLLDTTQDRQMAVMLAQYLGYIPYNQTTSYTKQVFVLDEVSETETLIPKGTIVTTEEEDGIKAKEFITQDNLKIPAGYLGNEKDGSNNYIYTVDVIQGQRVTDDVVGSSTGAAYQSFVLSYKNVLVDFLHVFVMEEGGYEEWERVNSLVDSFIDETSKVYTVSMDDYNNCIITFGNGVRGKIPPVFDGGIIANYIFGGGEESNVAANTITVIKEDVNGVEETFNPDKSYIRGHDREPIEEIKENAPLSFKTLDRAVTLADFGDLLKINNEGDFYGIQKAVGVRDENNNLNVFLYYQMRPNYYWTTALAAKVNNFFAPRKVIGSTIVLLPHETTTVNITANLRVDRDYKRAEVKQAVEDYIKQVFFKAGKFSFGDTYSNADIEDEIYRNVEGIIAFRITSQDDVDIIEPEDVQYILDVGTITITATGGIV